MPDSVPDVGYTAPELIWVSIRVPDAASPPHLQIECYAKSFVFMAIQANIAFPAGLDQRPSECVGTPQTVALAIRFQKLRPNLQISVSSSSHQHRTLPNRVQDARLGAFERLGSNVDDRPVKDSGVLLGR